ncbi:MAG: PEPxxWA-CTERM sorting domain-containing protein [Pseudomonadota bacterium]
MRFRLGFAAAASVLALSVSAPAMATTLIEDFEAPFPAWESGWLATNSNLQNYYGVGGDRGNNPDGLWISDGLGNGTDSVISFDAAFGATLSSFDIDIAAYATPTLRIWDLAGATLLSVVLPYNPGAYSDPGAYNHFSVVSTNGIGGFSLIGDSVEGNVSIDNVRVNLEGMGSAVPEPATWAMMITGFGLAGSALRRRRETSILA